MKFFLVGFLLSFSVFASDVEKQLEKKSANYSVLRKHYSALLALVNIQEHQKFCTQVRAVLPVLNDIYLDDQDLMKTLRTSQDPDYQEYAQLIEDNSYSPLFSYTAYLDLCDSENRESILRLGQSLQYHVMNIDYLSMSNVLFWQSVSSQQLVN